MSLARHGLTEPGGQCAARARTCIERRDEYLAHVEEGLGTKNLVADAMLELTGKSFYAQHRHRHRRDDRERPDHDRRAADLASRCTRRSGMRAWFDDPQRAEDLARGFAEGCRQAGAVWGGGETPALKGIVDPETIVLAGSAIGRIKPKSNRIVGDVRDGDAIVLLASSGVHTNGLTLCRALADRLPDGYLTKIDDGRTYGEALLDPSVIYVRFIAAVPAGGHPTCTTPPTSPATAGGS